MPTVKKQCRVCGKLYEACRTLQNGIGAFHWQEVACSPECGAKYLQMVTEARNPAPKAKRHAKTAKTVVEESRPVDATEAEPQNDEAAN